MHSTISCSLHRDYSSSSSFRYNYHVDVFGELTSTRIIEFSKSAKNEWGLEEKEIEK